MSAIVERARERVEEVRTRGVRTVLEERFPKIKEIGAGGGSKGILGRNPGIIATLEERFPKVREIRERGILAGVTKLGAAPAPAAPAPAAPAVPVPTLYPAAAEAPVKIDLMTKPRLY